MSEDTQDLIEELAVKVVEIEKRHAHDLVNAQTERRRRIRDAIDEVAGQIITADVVTAN
ncbi:MAG: hypothetical protein HQL43_12090 [Alphaproteobacteria bacterium]|nr:hypothetical protein [Alphaproteobacteria bacterium]